jgi:putative ABC transport system permease protein
MKKSRLIFRNLWFYRRPYLALLAGATISIAVLTGALAVGDSVRYSLQKLTDIRLGKTRYVLQSKDHLFREKLAADLSKEINEDIAPLFLSEGIAVNSEKEKRINRVDVIGINDQFSRFWDKNLTVPGEDEAVISENIASKLELKPGDEFLLRIRKHGNTPQNAPFSAERTISVSLRLKVKAIAVDENAGRFSLKNNQAAPFNIFISLKQLNSALELNGKANLLLVAGENNVPDYDNNMVLNRTIAAIHPSPEGEGAGVRLGKLDSLLAKVWQPHDAGLRIRKLDGSGQFEIISDRIFLDEKVAGAIRSSIPASNGILTYLANSLSSGSGSTPYSFVTAANEVFLQQHLNDREIIINEWLANDLKVNKGDSLTMNYFVMGPLHSLKEKSAGFIVRSVIPMNDPLCDPALMPDFPGITDAGNCRDWETATPIDLKKIRDKDEKYWKDFRGTPKAFISLKTGQELWKNRFGNYTAFRFKANDQQICEFERSIMQKLKPSENGLSFIPVYKEGKIAAANSTDFGGLFLSLSFFIIVSGLLLMAMIFSVHTHARLTETGVLSAMGFRKGQVIRILLAESAFVAGLAGILGSFAGIGYNRLLLLGLNTLWQDSVRTSALEMHIHIPTLITGAIAGIVMALLILFLVLHRNLKRPLVVLLMASKTHSDFKKKKFRVSSIKFPRFFSLVLKNLRLNLKRTLGAVVLLAIGIFTIIITGANRKIFPGDSQNRQSGTGGFLSWAETTIPNIYDLNTEAGKKQFSIDQDSLFRDVRFLQMYRLEGNDASCLNLNRVSQPALLGIDVAYFDKVSAFRFQTFDPSIPQSLNPSIPQSLNPSIPQSLNPSVPHNHPWQILKQPLSDGVIPGFADLTVIKWGLGKSVGDTLIYKDESGKPLKIKLMGGLDNSIFQGNILISDSLFRIYYPSAGGSKVMLVDGSFSKRQAISDELEQVFRDYGMVVTPTSQRLDEFNSVQNTYLSVFMLLGGLGVIIGTFGLGFLLIRNLMDRQQELAIYFALGFRKNYIIRLLTVEHLLILVSGIGIGIVAALPVIFPLLLSPASEIPFGFLAVILGLIFISGFLWIIFPVRAAMKKNIIVVLKKEN